MSRIYSLIIAHKNIVELVLHSQMDVSFSLCTCGSGSSGHTGGHLHTAHTHPNSP